MVSTSIAAREVWALATRGEAGRLPGGCELLERLMRAGRTADVVGRAHTVAQRSTDPVETAQAYVQRLAALVNLGQVSTADFRSADQDATAALERCPEPSLIGQYHALAAAAADMSGQTDVAVVHLFQSRLALSAEPDPSASTALGWNNLACAQSAVGLAKDALASLVRSEEIGNQWRRRAQTAGPRIEAALALDHQGDSVECVRQLDDLLGAVRGGSTEELAALTHWESVNLAYAAARLAVLGGDPGIDPRRLLRSAADGFTPTLTRLVLACHAIVGGRPGAALALLDTIPLDSPVGLSELLRMRSLALSALGDHAEALAVERSVFRTLGERAERIQRLLIDHQGPRPDQDFLRHTLATYAVAALTDPLTGLPNRRHLDQRLAELVADGGGGPAVLGVLDLDRFKDVNTVHGHVVGDLVLCRVAEVLGRALHQEDFVARYGGDEFVALLPGRTMEQAREIGLRIAADIASENWCAIAPGTPVGISIGWTDLAQHTTAQSAVAAADRAMYGAKPSAGV